MVSSDHGTLLRARNFGLFGINDLYPKNSGIFKIRYDFKNNTMWVASALLKSVRSLDSIGDIIKINNIRRETIDEKTIYTDA